MINPFQMRLQAFVEQMARMVVPGDDDPAMAARVKAAQVEMNTGDDDVEGDVLACTDDEFLCSETLTLWEMIREARELLK
jgi:hypothetical protein